jgi:ADP-dependent NAD(P)H-hydrate dehydratase / NAD(P)H-hydrate epimerase
MNKVLSVEQIREADSYTIKNEPVDSVDLMERASKQCVDWISQHRNSHTELFIFCGPGNNGGDGLAMARLLCELNYKVVVLVLRISDQNSENFKENYERLTDQEKCKIIEINNIDNFPLIPAKGVVIDAIFGSGLTKPTTGVFADIINEINKHSGITIAIDIPSGLYADINTDGSQKNIIKADYTLSFEFPKYAFFMAENDQYVGHWVVLPIGLSEEYIREVKATNYLLDQNDIKHVFRKRLKFSHKGNYGHALLIAGSVGKMGAAILASNSCLRAGVGLLTAHIPNKGNDVLQMAVPEAMVSLGRFENYFSDVPELGAYNAIGVGPGIGLQEQTQNSLKVLIQNSDAPIVFDADALNILAENKTWLAFLPKGCIFTPHPKEFERLAGKWNNDFELAAKVKTFAVDNNVVLVLKGAHTQIATPAGECFFNKTGNPGMATAGSGDVLTGIILGLLAQNYSSVQAAIIGVYIHGLAGDLAAKKIGKTALIASDLIKYMGKAFKNLESKK